MTADDQTEAARKSQAILRAMPPEYHSAWIRMGIRLLNDVPPAKAEALFWQEVSALGWRGN